MEKIIKEAEENAVVNFKNGLIVSKDFHRSVLHQYYNTEEEVECYVKAYHDKIEKLMNDEDNYPTEHRYFVYNDEDECISDGFHFEDDAIAFANANGYPVVKIHRYYRDPNKDFKLYPDGDPETTWANGKPVVK